MPEIFSAEVRFYCTSIHFHSNMLLLDGFDNQVFMLKHGSAKLDALRRGLAAVKDDTRKEERF